MGRPTNPDADLEKAISLISRAIARGSAEENVTLYRGIKDYGEVFEVGGTYHEPAFWSLTADRELAHDYAGTFDPGYVFVVRVPAGTHAAFPEGLGVSEGESEILLDRGTIYKVTSIQEPIHPGGHTIITVEVQA